ncbi:MAG: DAK2 domain-containing protein [Anaerolineales bacterium]|nr:MAG: DAK2 domain-containing protein [Anaerolineales bacterium]
MTNEDKTVNFCSGIGLRRALEASTAWLERHVEIINALNVYPVPDGDTGTNMLLTMQAALKELNSSPAQSASVVAHAVSYGSLMGARGNSGVILSQLFRGLARSLDKKETFTALELAQAMPEASAIAYQGVIKPVEGTILTVAREAADAAMAAAEENNDLLYVLERTVTEARHSVARTPSLLQVLADAGVVDAGGQGLFIILEGALRFMRGEEVGELPTVEAGVELEVPVEEEYGYETMFILKGEDLNVDEIREAIAAMGESVLVVGDSRALKVHIHSMEPGRPLDYAAKLGTLIQISVENLQEQYQEFVRHGGATVPGHPPPPPVAEELGDTAIVVVAPGEGLARVFGSLGVSAVVPGGQSMNPSTQEILKAIEGLKAEKVIVLPNNSNVIMAARQTRELSQKEIVVVPTATIPQGISAVLAFNYQADLEANAQMMEQAAHGVQTAEITTATRDAQITGGCVEEGEIIGLLNGELTASGGTLGEVVQEMLRQMKADEHEIITTYYGEGIAGTEAQKLADEIQASYSDQDVELIDGGQPHYHYIMSVE